MRQGIPVYTPSWVSPLGDQTTEELDWGQITATPTQSYEDWGLWIQTTRQYRRKQRTGDSYFQHSIMFRSVENIIQTVSAYLLLQTVLFQYHLSRLQPSYFQRISVLHTISYESSGITGIAAYKGAFNFSGANWFSQAVQHTVFGEEGQISITGTGAESITPFIPEGSGSLFKLGGAAESSTKAYLVGDYQYLSGVANVNFAPITGIGTGTFSQGREKVKHTHELFNFHLMSLVELLISLVLLLRRIQNTTTDPQSSSVKRTKITEMFLVRMSVVDSLSTFLESDFHLLTLLMKEILPLIMSLRIKHMMRQLVVVEFSHHLIRIINTTSTSAYLPSLRIVDLLDSVLLVVDLTLKTDHLMLDSLIKVESTKDMRIKVGSTKRRVNLRSSHSELQIFKVLQAISNTPLLPRFWYTCRIWYRCRESCCCK